MTTYCLRPSRRFHLRALSGSRPAFVNSNDDSNVPWTVGEPFASSRPTICSNGNLKAVADVRAPVV
jgi:hypothetical protein